MFSADDAMFMAEALRLAAHGRYTTSPNPNVGAVVVKNNTIIGRGYHRQAGGPHAEVFALQEAAEQAQGSTCYVTLEPCCHYGRTPPCAEALIAAQVSRVVVAMLDPNPQVAGRGVALLQQAGITVDVGLMADQARLLNPGFLSRMERQRPYVQLKMASSLDGRTALSNGNSKWLTGEAARADVQHFRAQSCAILSTAATVLADDARLTVREEQLTLQVPRLSDGSLRQPKRVVLDRHNRLTGTEALFSFAGDIIICRATESEQPLPAQVKTVLCPLGADGRFDLAALLQLLGQQQINSVWVEAGATMAGDLLQKKLVDQLIVYVAPALLGQHAMPLAVLPELTALTDAVTLHWQDIRQVGQDLRLIATLT